LRVLPGSHLLGELDPQHVEALAKETAAVACIGPSGSVLAMRPLLLHASSPASQPVHRRVVHLEYASEPLPGGLRWPEVSGHSL
jgi:hypothetical protein